VSCDVATWLATRGGWSTRDMRSPGSTRSTCFQHAARGNGRRFR
jgi:hypothetical protein